MHPFRSYFREQNSPHGINNTVRSARRRMFDLGLTHDQVAAAKERAGTSVWNYFESLRTHNGLFPGTKFIVCVFIALYSLGALTGIAYSLGIEYVIVMVLAPPSTAAANLPPSMHPFAMQCARWIENRLPKPSRGNQSPVYMLSKALGDLSHLYTFGCLCLVTLPGPLRSGDKHFMDRGAPGLYLGPSEEGQCHLAYVFALRRVLPVAKIRVWEDEFPGLRGNKYRWFPDDPVVGSLSGWNQQRCALQRASWLCEWTSTGPQQFAAAYLCATIARRAFAPAPRRRLGRLKLGDQILVQRRVFLLHGMHLSLVLEDATLSHSLQCRVGVLWLHARSQGYAMDPRGPPGPKPHSPRVRFLATPELLTF